MEVEIGAEMSKLLQENGIDSSLANNILRLTEKVNKKKKSGKGGTILRNKQRTNEIRTNEVKRQF